MTHTHLVLRVPVLLCLCAWLASSCEVTGGAARDVSVSTFALDTSPAQVEAIFGTSLAEYWDARAGVSASGGRVVTWAGLKNGSVLSATNQPVYGPDGSDFGGVAVVQSSIANDAFLSGPLSSSLLATGARPYIAVVHRSRALHDAPARFLQATSANGATSFSLFAEQASTRGMYCPDWPNGGCEHRLGTADETLRPVVTELWADSDGLHYVQDGREDFDTVGLANLSLVRPIELLALGAIGDSNQLSDSSFALVVVASALPSVGQRDTFRAYAASVWGTQNPCGDGVLNAGEECDDGNSIDGDLCSNTCTNNTALAATPVQLLGDSVVEWWDARVGVGTTAGSVTAWRGQKSGTVMKPDATPAGRPAYAVDSGFFQDRPVIQSSVQNNAYLSGGLSPTLLPLNVRPYVAVIHRSRTLSTSPDRVLQLSSSDTNTSLGVYAEEASARGLYCPNWPSLDCQYYLDSNNEKTVAVLTELWVDQAGTHYAENGVESTATRGSANQPLIQVLEKLVIGAVGSNNQVSDSSIAQVVLASALPSAHQRLQYMYDACETWGVPACGDGGGVGMPNVLDGTSLLDTLNNFSAPRAQFPEGFSGLLDFSLVTVPPSSGSPQETVTVVAGNDNPQLLANIATRLDIESISESPINIANCAPTVPNELGAPQSNVASCDHRFRVTNTPGIDRVWAMANPIAPLIGRGGFFRGMTLDTQTPGLYKPSYSSTSFPPAEFQDSAGADPFLFFRGGCPGSSDPNCGDATFPMLFPSLHLPMDANGQVQEVDVSLLLTEDSAISQLGPTLAVSPGEATAPDHLIVVPVHVHSFDNSMDEAGRRAFADKIANLLDDVGGVDAHYAPDEQQGSEYAKLTRPVGTSVAGSHERVFATCRVGLRLASVQFHPRSPELLTDGKLSLTCDNGCNVSACETFFASGQPLAEAVAGFANTPPTGTPKGIHVVFIEQALESSQIPGQPPTISSHDGRACERRTSVPPTAFTNSILLIDHELTHVFGFGEPTVENVVNAGEPFSPEQCQLLRAEAQAIVDLPE